MSVSYHDTQGDTPCIYICFVFVTPEGFTIVANEGLEKAKAYFIQVPWDRQLYVPSKADPNC